MTSQTVSRSTVTADERRRHCSDSTRRHPRYPLISQYVHGVALCELPESFDKYYYLIEASARRISESNSPCCAGSIANRRV